MTEYTVLTPYGSFVAQWSDDPDERPQYSGDQDAIDYFREYLSTAQVTGRGGARLSMEGMEPADLYGFCESTEYGIAVAPTFDDLLDEAAEADAPGPALDSARGLTGPMDVVRKAAELAKRLRSKRRLD